MDWTKIIAIWGAALSSVLAILRIIEFLNDRGRLHVSVRGGYKDYYKNTIYGDATLLCIAVVNHGRRPITVTEGGLLYPRRFENKYLKAVDSLKDIQVEEGRRYLYYMTEDEIKNSGLKSKEYVAYVRDTKGKIHWSHCWVSRLIKTQRLY